MRNTEVIFDKDKASALLYPVCICIHGCTHRLSVEESQALHRQLGAALPAPSQTSQQLCRCGSPGRPRIDNGLAAGVHCDSCWDNMIQQCRSRSW